MRITLKTRYGKHIVIANGWPKGFKTLREALAYINDLRKEAAV